MNKKHIYITLFIIAIVGLSFIQYQYFRIGLNLASVQFNQKMGDAVKDIKQGLFQRNELTFLTASALKGNSGSFKLSQDSLQDASIYFIQDFLQQKLVQNGVKTEFSFSLYDADSTVILHSTNVFEQEDKLLIYPIVLEGYLPDVMKEKMVLSIQFRNVNRYFLSQINGLTIPSIVFLIIIIVVILWVYRAFYLQNNLIVTTNEFINNLTHELKTPVFSIGVASKLLEAKGHEDSKELIVMIREQVGKLKGQIDKVLELGSIEEKKGFVQSKPVDMQLVLKEVVQNFRQQAVLNNFTFKSNIDEKPIKLQGDAYHLENAISSLVDNAVKYSGDIVDITLDARESKGLLEIKISDKGIGISKVDQKKIFDKYYRVTDGDLHNVKGHGLGLHYVKRIVHLHKGSIKLKSEPGKGTTFTIVLPLK
ncbi:sensor histidine kinase [Lutimonas sp.]|uniref:sensor histidine kinase n=1 Tax=Lutimonas sp. TaxID=1872403 RepID=UPI003D9B4CBB